MFDASSALRAGLLGMARNDTVRRVVQGAPVSRDVVRRYVAGEDIADAIGTASQLHDKGLLGTLDFLGEDCTDLEQAKAARDAYLDALTALKDAGLAERGAVEVGVKLSAVGQALPGDGHKIAVQHAQEICAAAAEAGTTVTIDMEDHTTTDDTLEGVRELRADFPWVGAVLQAYLRRTEADCRDLASAGSRIRLCKGAYDEPGSVAFQEKSQVDLSYVRCLKVLMHGDGYPMVASHDPRLIQIAGSLADRCLRASDSFEYQLLYGIRPDEQERLSDVGQQVRVYVPYGDQWYGYLMRRMAERPANAMFFARSLVTRG